MGKPYIRKMPVTWWLRHRAYFYFMLREFTAVFIGAYCVFLLVMLYHLKTDTSSMSYADFELKILQSPWSVAFHFFALSFAIYHSITSFRAAPVLMVIRMGEEKVSPSLIVWANISAWLIVSAFLCFWVFGF